MPGFWVWRVGVNTLIANWRWRDYLLVLGGRKQLLLAIIGPRRVVAEEPFCSGMLGAPANEAEGATRASVAHSVAVA